MRKQLALVVLLGAVAIGAAAGCGASGGSDEVVLGDKRSDAAGQEQRIAALERRLREKRRARARDIGSETPAAGGAVAGSSSAQSFAQLESSLGGQAGLTIGRVGDPDSTFYGSLSSGSAWSTIKLAIAAQVLSEAGGPSGLRGSDGDLIRSALTASDNAAAAALFDKLAAAHGGIEGGADAVGEPLRAAGDTRTVVSSQGRGEFSPYGQTEWPLADQHRFMSRLAAGCVPDSASAQYVLQLMSEVVPDQQWGLGSAGVPARFKGGWGPGLDGGYLVRQAGVLEIDGPDHAVVVTMAALPGDGQFATGQQMLNEIAAWVVEHVDGSKATPVGC